jgi:FSR family fosmidomycin resistance protein-like MFS transporter
MMSQQALVPGTERTDESHDRTIFAVILAIGICHLLNDMMQSLLPAIYPNLKEDFSLNFREVGLVTFTYQVTASLLQPLVGLYADRRPTPTALPGGVLFSMAGLLILSAASNYAWLLVGAAMLGIGSSVFHPESSRVARMAAGTRHGLAQSMFQVGGNAGQALGPLAAALVVVRWGQSSLAFFAALALVSMSILWKVSSWYKHHGLARLATASEAISAHAQLSKSAAVRGVVVLLVLVFSKYIYMASLSSYYTFYLIDHFHLSVRNAQLYLFAFTAAIAIGTAVGGPFGDRIGRKRVLWISVFGPLPFTLLLPYVNLFWTGPLSVIIGLLMASAFPAIVVFGQELIPGKVGMISGLFFGFAFGVSGLGAAGLGALADATSIEFVYRVCAVLPLVGLLTALLPDLEPAKARRPKQTPDSIPRSGSTG